jgi:hypothetical protein
MNTPKKENASGENGCDPSRERYVGTCEFEDNDGDSNER